MSKIFNTGNSFACHLLNVYLMKIPEQMEISSLFPPERDMQLQNIKNEKRRKETYAVWKLLEKAISHSYGLKMEDINFSLSNSKWKCDKLSFSLSHSHGAVAVAVSNAPCGIDIENLDKFALRHKDTASIQKVMRQICAENEIIELSTAQEVLSVWTKKESIFKCYSSDEFFSKKIDSHAHATKTIAIDLGNTYIFSVCGDMLNSLQCYVLDEGNFHEIAI